MDQKNAQVVRAVELYYQRSLTQQKISEMMGVSRPTVSRLLEEAKKQGFVEIKVNTPVSLNSQLSELLRTELNLKDVLVTDSEVVDYEITLPKVAEATSLYFSSIIKTDSVIGISWGRTIKAFVDKLSEFSVPEANVIQIVGGLGGGNPAIDGQELAYKMARKLSCAYQYIHAPAILSNSDTVRELMEQKAIKDLMDKAKSANIYLSAVGSFDEEQCSIERSGYLGAGEKGKLLQSGAVGHLLAHPMDESGVEISPFNERILSIPLAHLQKAEWSIGIAATAIKAKALLAAIKGRYYNVIIVDKGCAQELLRLLKNESVYQIGS
ncbi:sugar-binding domain-containing protein [Bacillus sp. B15-48]|uniref:sugar-binding transcriptional regulator n=1 Tax=Bacillus sp. B15-48 TaxID=1548601 RepID=UPI00193F6F8C|nr:sugar-binding domain-containing protein [Bacillus sp. B15-48]MBM4761106.1 helix-turn-helix domain-containing protein [Bacillus sp. B15-48]